MITFKVHLHARASILASGRMKEKHGSHRIGPLLPQKASQDGLLGTFWQVRPFQAW